ncbi:hypothetical protein Tco_0012212 [Tanacetum coccineum]
MTTVNQGMSVEEIERVVAQRVDNAIEAIAIYETKTNMAHKSMSQAKRQEDKCAELKKVRHLTRYCCEAYWLLASKDIIAKMWGFRGHYKSDCPKLKNQNHGNQAEGTEACGMVYALGGGDTDQDPNNIEDETET